MKLFASDLDGTLLDENHNLGQLEKELIQELIAKNYQFSVVTGRSNHSVKRFFEGIQGLNYIILNGALAYNSKKQLVYDCYIDKDIAKKIIDLLSTKRKHFIVYGIEDAYCSNLFVQSLITYAWSKSISKSLRIFKDFKKFKTLNFNVYKIEVVIKDKKLAQMLYQIPNVVVVKSGEYTYEITNAFASKKDALLALIKELSIHEDEVVCFGDNENDLTMLKHFKHSYVMANAKESIKSQIKNIIGKNSQHGVYFKIKELINEK